MALSLHNLFCSGSEDFDDEDFLSALEGTESGLSLPEPTTIRLRPISNITAKESQEPGNQSHHTSLSPEQQAATAQEDRATDTPSAPSLVQDVDDDELMSVCSELEAEVTERQCQAPERQLLLRPINHTPQRNSADSNNSSSFRLRPSRSDFGQDLGTRQCLRGIQSYNLHAGSPMASRSGQCPSPGPTAKRPCLRPSMETPPVRAGTGPYPSYSPYPRCSMPPSTSGPTNIWQSGPGNSAHPLPRTPLSSPRPQPPSALQTPVVTNHLLQLMTAANNTPKKLAWETQTPKERRFPGPAGLLPQQGSVRGLDEIMVSTPHTPNHGARAKLHSKVSSQQPLADEFIRGPWATMKAEWSLDENDPTCFLRTYSVVMVLRKAALKQLPRNKVPRMAVALKTLTPANGDASAVFRDSTGDIQGTVHHLLLEERESELKIGSVLLLQQVGVFSPSHRNHYLNVTPSNIVTIYPPTEDGGTPRVPASYEEVEVNSNEAQTAHHHSSNTTQPSAHQPAPSPPLSNTTQPRILRTLASHPSPNSMQPRIPQPTTSYPSSSTAQPRISQPTTYPSSSTSQPRIPQPTTSYPSSSTSQPRIPQPTTSYPSSSTAQPRIPQPTTSYPSSSTAQPRIPQPTTSYPSSSTAQPRIPQPTTSYPSSSTAQPRIPQPTTSYPSSSTAQPRIPQPTTFYPLSSTSQPRSLQPAVSGDWDMDDLDYLLCDLPEDPGL